MKRFLSIVFFIFLLTSCMGRIAQLEQSGLNIDPDSNDAVEEAYGGTNVDNSAATGFPRFDAGVGSTANHFYQTWTAFTNDDTTPDVSGGEHFRVNYTGTVTITDFDGTQLQDGRRLWVYFDEDMSGTVTIDLTGSGIESANRTARDLVALDGAVYLFVYSTDDNNWHFVNAPRDEDPIIASFNPQAIYDNDSTNHALTLHPKTPRAYTITAIYVTSDIDPTTELTLTFGFISAGVGYTSPTTIEAVATSAGIANVTSGIDDATIPAGSKIFVTLSDPDDLNLETSVLIEGGWD